MAALAWSRTSEITDALVDLFISLVSKINTRAERKVDKAMQAEAAKVHRKTEKLFSIAEGRHASRSRPQVFRIGPHHRNSSRNSLTEHPDLGVHSDWRVFRWGIDPLTEQAERSVTVLPVAHAPPHEAFPPTSLDRGTLKPRRAPRNTPGNPGYAAA